MTAGTLGTRRRVPWSKRVPRIIAVAIVVVGLIAVFLPFAWVLLTAFKPPLDARAIPPKILPPYTLNNFASLFNGRFLGSVATSVILAVVATVPTMAIGIPAGYALSRGRFATRRLLGGWLLFMLLMPRVVFILPMYLFFHQLGLIDTYLGLALAYMSGLLPFAIWLMSGYFADIPIELEEAARIDGCSRWQAFLRVDVPLALPGIATVGIFVAIGAWNEYLAALILGGPHTTPATVGITTYVGQFSLDYGQLAAGAMFLLVPILVLTVVAQRGLLRGVTAGAVKG